MQPSRQKLPWEVVYLIVCCVADTRQASKKIIHNKRFNGSTLVLPLAGTSQVWRSAVLTYLCRAYVVTFSNNNQVIAGYKRWIKYKTSPESYANKFVRRVNVEANIASIASGQSFMDLVDSPVHLQKFCKARTLKLRLLGNWTYNSGTIADAGRNVAQFCGMLKTMVPAATNAKLTYNGSPSSDTVIVGELVSILARNLFSGAKSKKLELFADLQLEVSVANPVSSLTSLNVTWRDSYKPLASLIRLCSQSLAVLEITFIAYNGLENLVRDGQLYITYPNLQKLVLSSLNGCSSPCMAFGTTGVLFPTLNHLQLEVHYPFSDDTLFRGNSKTLEYLKMIPDTTTFDMLISYRKFAKLQDSNLKHMLIAHTTYRVWKSDWETTTVGKFIKTFSSSLRRLSLPVLDMSIPNLDMANFSKYFSPSIKVLELKNKEMCLIEFLTILKALPALTSLVCGYSANRHLETQNTYIDTLYSQNYPLNNNFWHWRPYYKSYANNGKSAAKCAMILAILCPKFGFAEIWSYGRSQFNNAIQEELSREPYDKYANKIECLLYTDIIP
ncbi:hypothetical protein COEREDRAFT_86888 [Coemansia reversa NRRL 1564]|uniref:F-box domain-containing protein n=1 Tax=Coemansia reversa (strain ATCC 12441 / NRRL 1564) TaxID=763665 RepID=A0A2G5BBU9_COERN|nr:hypothetical protein COEREDRAFT_86888 [Coemansia reversa NRRL 1564]|eukprot:PIA16486.1 hypothetical protein COEREDRAFT_86888 [Coemansia reversa NRRL 1564]